MFSVLQTRIPFFHLPETQKSILQILEFTSFHSDRPQKAILNYMNGNSVEQVKKYEQVWLIILTNIFSLFVFMERDSLSIG